MSEGKILRILRPAGVYLFILLMGICVAFALMVAVYALPTGRMLKNLKKSADIISEEGAYPTLYGGEELRMEPDNLQDPKVFFLNTRGTARDNVTDCTMLNIAVYDNQKGLVEKAMGNARAVYGYYYTVRELEEYLTGNDGYSEEIYPWYWHGYLVVLKPLLLLLTYEQIRWLNVGVLSLLLIVLLWKLVRQNDSREDILFLCAVMFTAPIVIPFCMQYCTISYIALIAMLILVIKKAQLSTKWVGNFFLLTGMVTSFIDFLTYPLLTLGLPLVYLLNVEKNMSFRQKCRKFVVPTFYGDWDMLECGRVNG